jgi:hypothetical protein
VSVIPPLFSHYMQKLSVYPSTTVVFIVIGQG